ncbi:hypothetical protein MNBD_GAMMA22-2373 [hydrothermal vent metagenome]|uniref:Uncharacterized protein n=1 Tax=hydrothermal vent metagenome TaxID=652676 RepID=A0A3B0ZXI6_9ZZZZ
MKLFYTLCVSIKYQKLCPFSKPVIGGWCECPYASLMERCTGKIACHRDDKFFLSCSNLANSLKNNSSFILGLNNSETLLTHAQSMKIRCGGMLGMQRVMNIEINSPPVIPNIIAVAELLYNDACNFPFNEIVQDIKSFNHRKKRL